MKKETYQAITLAAASITETVKNINDSMDFRTSIGERFSHTDDLDMVRTHLTPTWTGSHATFIYTFNETGEEIKTYRDGAVRTSFGEHFDNLHKFVAFRTLALPCSEWVDGDQKRAFVYEISLESGETTIGRINAKGRVKAYGEWHNSIYDFRTFMRQKAIREEAKAKKNNIASIGDVGFDKHAVAASFLAHNEAESQVGHEVVIKHGGHIEFSDGSKARGVVKNAGRILAERLGAHQS